jgi:ribosomal-protein-alanine N-acetyltransferase
VIPIGSAPVAALSELHIACMGSEGWTEASLARLLSAPAARGLALERSNGAVAGFVLAFAAADEAEILALCVAPDARRQGHARALLQRLARDLAGQGIAALHLEVRASNTAARLLYAAAGFKETGRRKGYYAATPDRPQEDAVLMASTLDPAAIEKGGPEGPPSGNIT